MRADMIEGAAFKGNLTSPGVLLDGTAVEMFMRGCSLPATVWVEPLGGDTVTVTYKTAANATAQPWPPGAAATYKEDVLDAPVFSIIFQRTAGTGNTSKYGVTR